MLMRWLKIRLAHTHQFQQSNFKLRAVAKQGIIEGVRTHIPTEYDDLHTTGTAPVLSITGSDLSVTHAPTEQITLTVTATGSYPLTRAELFVNNKFIGQSNQVPLTFSFTTEDIKGISSENEITIIGYDAIMNKGTYSAKLLIK